MRLPFSGQDHPGQGLPGQELSGRRPTGRGPSGWAAPSGAIRLWKAADIKPLVAIADNRKIWLNLRDRFPHPYTAADARKWVREAVHRPVPITDFALESGGRLVGGIGLLPGQDIHRHTAEVGYWLGEPFWGRGLATAALAAFTEYAFVGMGFRRLFASVLEWNPASARVLEKCGYRLEARLRKSALKDGRLLDELLYARVSAAASPADQVL